MPLALILSSYVAGSRVGGMAQTLALAPFKVDPVLIPTVLFGRHPGWGPPGGGAVEPARFREVLEGVAANGLLGRADAVLAGYFADADQVAIAAEAIDRVRAADRVGAFAASPVVVVDPIMGDDGAGLYVRPEVAEAIARLLVPRADWLTPNAWELARLSGRPVHDAVSAVAAARALGKPVLATSIPGPDGGIGQACVTADEAVLFSHRRYDRVPHGTGDLVTAVFAAGLIGGGAALEAAEQASRAVAETVSAAADWNSPELPIVALVERLARPTAEIRVEAIA